jgi:hypothetical protein
MNHGYFFTSENLNFCLRHWPMFNCVHRFNQCHCLRLWKSQNAQVSEMGGLKRLNKSTQTMVFLFSFKWKRITFHAFYNIYSQSTGPRSPLFAKSHIKTKWTLWSKNISVMVGFIIVFFMFICYLIQVGLLFLRQKHHKVKILNQQILSSIGHIYVHFMFVLTLFLWQYVHICYVNGSRYLEREMFPSDFACSFVFSGYRL